MSPASSLLLVCPPSLITLYLHGFFQDLSIVPIPTIGAPHKQGSSSSGDSHGLPLHHCTTLLGRMTHLIATIMHLGCSAVNYFYSLIASSIISQMILWAFMTRLIPPGCKLTQLSSLRCFITLSRASLSNSFPLCP